MKYVFGILVILIAMGSSSWLRANEGDTLQFSCKFNEPVVTQVGGKEVKKYHNVEVKFRVLNIGMENIKLGYLSKKDEEESNPIEVIPNEFSGNHQSVLHKLNDQGGDIRLYFTDKKSKENKNVKPADKKKELVLSGFRLFGDSDGVDFVNLIVWKNVNYEGGYVQYKGDDKKYNWYEKITCTHRAVK